MRVLGQHQHGSYEDFKKRVRENLDAAEDTDDFIDEMLREVRARVVLHAAFGRTPACFIVPIPADIVEQATERITQTLVELSELTPGGDIKVKYEPDGDDWVALTAVIDLRG